MPSLSIRLDCDEHGGFSGLRNATEVVHVTAPFEVGTLRAGMQSGKDSVALCIPLPDGKVAIVETSAGVVPSVGTGDHGVAGRPTRQRRGMTPLLRDRTMEV